MSRLFLTEITEDAFIRVPDTFRAVESTMTASSFSPDSSALVPSRASYSELTSLVGNVVLVVFVPSCRSLNVVVARGRVALSVFRFDVLDPEALLGHNVGTFVPLFENLVEFELLWFIACPFFVLYGEIEEAWVPMVFFSLP